MTFACNRTVTVPSHFEGLADTTFSYFDVTILSRRGSARLGELQRGTP